MHQADDSLVQKSRITGDVLVVNQCGHNGLYEYDTPEGRAKMIFTTDRGLTRSRNMAIANSRADICLLCDDDEVFVPDYEKTILSAYEDRPQADVIIFKMVNYPAAFEDKIPVAYLTWEQVQALDAGLWFAEEFRGTKVPMLSEVLAFAKEKGIHVKIDNVFARFSEHQQGILFDVVEKSGADAGFTCPDIATIKNVVARFPKTTIHYDGFVDQATLEEVSSALAENPLIVWLPFDNAITAWCKLPKASKEMCDLAHNYGRVGVWLLHEEEDRRAAESFGADIIETTGSLKP